MRVKSARGMKVTGGTNGRRLKYDAQYTRAALIWLRPIFHRTFAIRHSRGARGWREWRGDSPPSLSKSSGLETTQYRPGEVHSTERVR